ncbi:hypothetical protein tb265_19920 [Gemmatimonadetes bacterium T265]|nr:hypothetical protein tb265_19920 [Gemmatimonadetes bacterium T265]
MLASHARNGVAFGAFALLDRALLIAARRAAVERAVDLGVHPAQPDRDPFRRELVPSAAEPVEVALEQVVARHPAAWSVNGRRDGRTPAAGGKGSGIRAT